MAHKPKHKLDIQLFLSGFILSVVFMSLVLGLLFVNYNAYQSGNPDYTPLISYKDTRTSYTFSILGNELELNKDWLDLAEPYLQKLTVFLPSMTRSFAASWNQLGQLAGGGLPPGYSVSPEDEAAQSP